MSVNINNRNYSITRVPIIKAEHFEKQAKQLTDMGIAVTAEDQLAMWLDSMLSVVEVLLLWRTCEKLLVRQ